MTGTETPLSELSSRLTAAQAEVAIEKEKTKEAIQELEITQAIGAELESQEEVAKLRVKMES